MTQPTGIVAPVGAISHGVMNGMAWKRLTVSREDFGRDLHARTADSIPMLPAPATQDASGPPPSRSRKSKSQPWSACSTAVSNSFA